MKDFFQSKTIVITGASAGLGKALVKQIAAYNCNIAGLARSTDALNNLKDELENSSSQFLPVTCDVSKEEACKEAIQEVLNRFGKIDMLINNAGFSNIRLFEADKHIAITREVMETNFFGAVYCTAFAHDSIVAQKGSIVNISSVAGYSPLVGRTAYAASKHAMHGFFNTLGAELSVKGVHVMVVCPTFIETNIRRDSNKKVETEALTPEYVAHEILKGIVKKQRTLIIGKTAVLAWWMNRMFPSLYEKLMIKNQMKKIV